MTSANHGPNLVSGLHLGRREMVAFVGGAGALSVMLELERQVDDAGRVVRLGTTAGVDAADVAGLRHFVYDREVAGRLTGAPTDHFDGLMRLGWIEIVGIAADRADGRPFGAPDDDHPVIPRATTHVVVVIGADALDGVIDDVAAHPLRVAAIAGCRPHDRLTPERAARVVLDDRGGRKRVPAMARFSVVVTGVRDEDGPAVDEFVAHLRDEEAAITVVRVPFGSGIATPERLTVS